MKKDIYSDPELFVRVQKIKIVLIVIIGLAAWAAHGFPGVAS